MISYFFLQLLHTALSDSLQVIAALKTVTDVIPYANLILQNVNGFLLLNRLFSMSQGVTNKVTETKETSFKCLKHNPECLKNKGVLRTGRAGDFLDI